MAVAFDTSCSGTGNGVNAITTTAISTAGTNRGLVCFCHVSNTTPTAITFVNDGDDLTWTQLTGSPLAIPNLGGKFFVYHALAAAQLTTTTFTLTFTSGGWPQQSAIIAAYSGIDTAGFIGASTTGTSNFGTSMTANVTTTRANSLVIGGFGQTSNAAMTIGTNQTENAEVGSAGGFSRTMEGNRDAVTATSGTSVTMNTSWAGNLNAGMFAVELFEPSASTAVKDIIGGGLIPFAR